MINREKTSNWPYTWRLLSQLYQNWKWWIKIQKSLSDVFSFFYGHHLPEARKHPVEFHLCLCWKEIRLSSWTSFAKLTTIERRRSSTSLFYQIRKHQYCVAKKGGNGRQSTNILAPGMLGKQNKRGRGKGVQTMDREKGVGGWLRPVWIQKFYTVVFLVWELQAAIIINTWVFRWRSCFLLNDFQDSYVISRGVSVRSVQVNSSAILIPPRVVDDNFWRPYEYHCESLIVRIIFSYFFFASEDKSKGSLKIQPVPSPSIYIKYEPLIGDKERQSIIKCVLFSDRWIRSPIAMFSAMTCNFLLRLWKNLK